MAYNWSPENATKAYLRSLKMGKRGKEPDVAEYISALAAGNNAQLMVVIASDVVGPTTLALVAAARQTGGRVVCILSTPGLQMNIELSKKALGHYSKGVDFVIGDPTTLLLSDYYKSADFVLIDCGVKDYNQVCRSAKSVLVKTNSNHHKVIVGYNVFNKGSWSSESGDTHFLPIGDGLLLTRVGGPVCKVGGSGGEYKKRSRWVVRIDKRTGEEHVYRITSPVQETKV